MQSLPKKTNSKFAPPSFIKAPLCSELKEKVRPLRMLRSRKRNIRKEEAKSGEPANEEDFDEPSSARVIKLNWNWEDEQNQDQEPKQPVEISDQQFLSSKGGRRLRNQNNSNPKECYSLDFLVWLNKQSFIRYIGDFSARYNIEAFSYRHSIRFTR